VRSPSRAVLGVGAGLAAAGFGAALGLAAERWTAGRVQGPAGSEPYGSLRGTPHRVSADDGTTLYVEVDELDVEGTPQPGPHSPLTVVFSHGFCLNQDIWHFQRQWLRGRYRMVFWDQRGHGRSETGPSDHYDVDQCGRDLSAVIEAVAPQGPLVLVGHSMGGMTVMALAAERPELIAERVVGVAMIATSSGGLADVSWGLHGSISKVAHKIAPLALVGLTRTPRLVDRTRRIGSDLEQLVVKRYSYASPVPPELVQFTAAMIAATPIAVVSAFMPGFDVHDKAEALAALDGIEALVLSGEEDLLTPTDHSEEIVRRLPGAEHVFVPDAGHLVMLEHPDAVNLHLGDLLERADRAVARARGRAGRRPRLRRPRRTP
jgi:pimeloyl-ACP methyl ester carboxylesterase